MAELVEAVDARRRCRRSSAAATRSPLVLRRLVEQTRARFLVAGAPASRQVADLADHRVGGDQRRRSRPPPRRRALVERPVPARRERPERPGSARVSAGAAAPRSANTGVAASENALQLASSSSAARAGSPGSFAKPCLEVGARARRSPAGDVSALLMKPASCSRSRASAARTASASRASSASSRFCRARIASTSLRLAQRRVRALDDLGELVAARREAGAEVVEDQPEAVRIGLAHDVVDEVEVDRLAVAARAAAGTGPRPARRRGSARARAAARRPGARGWVGSHSTNFSPISDCGRIRQEASSRKSWNAGSSISQHDDRLARARGRRPRAPARPRR